MCVKAPQTDGHRCQSEILILARVRGLAAVCRPPHPPRLLSSGLTRLNSVLPAYSIEMNPLEKLHTSDFLLIYSGFYPRNTYLVSFLKY